MDSTNEINLALENVVIHSYILLGNKNFFKL